jgi:VanZ family protein
LRPISAAPHVFEHVVAFLVVGGVFEWAYPRDWRVATAAFPLIAALELLQLIVPGRHARFVDFLANVVGAYAGMMLVSLASRLRRGSAH